MPSARLSRRRLLDGLHRYLGLVAFGQVLLWSLSGVLMYTLDFGDLYRDPPPAPLPLQQSLNPEQLQQRLQQLLPGQRLTGLQLRNLGGALAYRLETADTTLLLDARGQRLDPLSPAWAQRIAVAGYTGSGRVRQVERLPRSDGNYVSARPIYRIRFDDAQSTEIYVDPASGELLARRKALWGLYNRMWEFHLMKYTPFPALNKSLLLLFAVINAVVALTGLLRFVRRPLRRKTLTERS